MDISAPNASGWPEVIGAALRRGVPIAECRIAAALLIDPQLVGSRSLERASGLARSTVLSVVPQDESELLVLIDRGSNDFLDPEPLKVVFQHRQSAVHIVQDLTIETGLSSSVSVKSVKTSPELNTYSLRARRMLDPHLDLWSNAPQRSVGRMRMGSNGWALAVAFGDSVVTLAEVRVVLGLSERGTRAALAKLAALDFVRLTRHGRHVAVETRFGRLADEEDAGAYRNGSRANRVDARHRIEMARLAHRHTPLGVIAWSLVRNRVVLGEDSEPVWREVAMTGTEEEIYDHLLAAEKKLRQPPPPPPSTEYAPVSDWLQFSDEYGWDSAAACYSPDLR